MADKKTSDGASRRRRNRSRCGYFRPLRGEWLEPRLPLALGDLLATLGDPSANQQAGSVVGSTVAVDGGYAVVGAGNVDLAGQSDVGRVYVFNSSTGALLRAIENPAPVQATYFGDQVAISGTTLVVGLPRHDGGKGLVYVFDAATGNLLRTLNNPTPAFSDQFGVSIAVSGNTIVVGATADDTGGTDSGSAYQFDAVTGNLLRTINNPTPANNDFFGEVAISGNTIVVGVAGDDTGGSSAGSLYVFDATTGNLLRTVNNPAIGTYARLGTSIAISGTTLVATAEGPGGGAALVFDATSGALQRTITNPAPAAGGSFSRPVAISGNTIVVGGSGDPGNTGIAYTFDATTGNLLRTLSNPNPTPQDNYGTAVGISGSTVIVGAPWDDTMAPDSGLTYLFDATTGNLQSTLVNSGPGSDDKFGNAVALSQSAIVVGAPFDDTGGVNSGMAYLYDAATGNRQHVLNNPTPAANDEYGWAVAVSGGLAVVGGRGDGNSVAGAGSVYVFDAASGSLLRTIANPAPIAFDSFGFSVALSGTTLVVGATGKDTTVNNGGIAYVFDAATGGLLWTLNDPTPLANGRFGFSVAVAGNTVVVGADGEFSGSPSGGEVHLFDATTGNLLRTLNNPTPASGDAFGQDVAIAGGTVGVGAPNEGAGASDIGAVYLFDATSGNLLRTVDNPTPGSQDHFGNSLALLGNTLVVGAWLDRTAGIGGGSVYVFDKNSGSLVRTVSNPFPADGNLGLLDGFGYSVGISSTRIVVGTPGEDGPAIDRGAVYSFDYGTSIIYLDASGNLVFTDSTPDGRNDNLRLSFDGANYTIQETTANLLTVSGIAGATGSGTSTVTIPAVSIPGNRILFSTGDGNDVLTLDLTAGNPLRAGGLTFDGGSLPAAAADRLIIAGGNQGAVTYNAVNANGGSIVLSNFGTITYSGLEAITNSGAASDAMFNLPSGPSAVTLGDDGTAGNSLSRLSGATLVTTDFANPTGSLTINRGNAGDTLAVGALPDWSASLNLGAPANPISAVTVDGPLTLAVGKNLQVASTSISFSSAAADLTLSAGGTATLTTDNFDLSTPGATLSAGTIAIQPATAGRPISLGLEVAGQLSLTDAELDNIAAATMQIGGISSGPITVGADITRAAMTAFSLRSSGAIHFSGGSLNTAGGNATLTPGTAGSVGVAKAGNDVVLEASGTLSFSSGSDLAIAINGTTVDTQYQQLNLVGKIDLTGIDLLVPGAYIPVIGESFTIVNNDAGDAVVGTFNGLPEGTIFVIISPGTAGALRITYRGGDGNDVVLTAVNAAPTLDAIADPAAIAEDAGQQTIGLTGISAGSGNTQVLTVSAVSDNPGLIPNPTVSYASPSATGTLSFTPVANQSGTAVITVTVMDNGGTANGAIDTFTRTFTISVTAVNDPPTLEALSDPPAVLEDAATQLVSLFGIAGGAGEAQVLTVTATSSNPGLIPNPTASYASSSGSGSLSYAPRANQSGTAVITVTVKDDGGTANSGVDTITRTFTVNVTPVNDPPTLVAIADPAAIVEDAVEQIINLSGISAGPGETQALTITAKSSNPALIPDPSVSFSSPSATGSLAYSPVANQSGTAVITVTVKDDGGTANSGVDTITRTFTVNVTPVNDPPTLVAIADPAAIVEDAVEQIINLSGISAGPGETQALTITAKSSNPALIPDPSVSFSSPSATGSLVYTPVVNQSGTTVITVTIKDDGGITNGGIDSIARTFTVNVTPVNDPPVAQNDAHTVTEDTPLTVPAPGLVANDSDIELDALDAVLDSGPANGTVSLLTGGGFTYLPALNYHGPDSFTYHANDGAASSGIATVALTVTPVNDAPVAGSDQYTLDEDTSKVVAAPGVFGNDTDVDSPAISLPSPANISGPASGTLTLNTDGSFRYTPAKDFVGADSFTYRASDGTDTSSVATVTLTILPINDPPVAQNDVHTVIEDQPLNVPAPGLVANDSDIELDPLDAVLISGPAHGTISLLAGGGFRYSPSSDYVGPDSFTYRPTDGSAHGDLATVTLTITPVNDPPRFIKGPDQQVHDEIGTRTILGWATAISAGPSDESALPGPQSLTFEVIAANPALFTELPAIDAQGTLTFAPRVGAAGTTQVTVKLRDSGGTLNGGADTSAEQTFVVAISRLRPWHYIVNPLDTTADDAISPIDAVIVINYLNGPGSGPVPSVPPPPNSYIDVDGDGFIAPIDAVLVINWLNAHPVSAPASGEGESAKFASASGAAAAGGTGGSLAELVELLALDAVGQRPRRLRAAV